MWRPPDITLSIAYPPNPRRPARVDAFIDRLRAELTRQNGLGTAFLETLQATETVTVAAGTSPTHQSSSENA